MPQTPYEAVWEFHKSFGQPRYTFPSLPAQARRNLRKDLLAEEYAEYQKGEKEDDLVQIADGLADMTYIIYGTGIEYGLPMDELFAEVHRSNMSKLDPTTGDPIYRHDGKIMKPPSYSKPDLASIIAYYQGEQDRDFPPEGPIALGDEAMDAIVEDAGTCEDDDMSQDEANEDEFYRKRERGTQMLNPPERFVVHANVYGPSKEGIDAFKEKFIADARAAGCEAIYYFLPTLGETRIERL